MKAFCKLKSSTHHDLVSNLFEYYTIYLVYSNDNDEILKKYKVYKDELINQIINKDSTDKILLFYYPDIIHVSILENNNIYNFMISKFNEWFINYF